MTLKHSWYLRTKECRHLFIMTKLSSLVRMWYGVMGPRHKACIILTKRTREIGTQGIKPVLSENKKIGELHPKGMSVLKKDNLILRFQTLSPNFISNQEPECWCWFAVLTPLLFIRIKTEKLSQRVSSIFPRHRLKGWYSLRFQACTLWTDVAWIPGSQQKSSL